MSLYHIISTCNSRLLEFVEDVLNIVEVAPDDAFEFVSVEFGVKVEVPPLAVDTEKTFALNITAIFNEISNITTTSMQMEATTELPPAMVTLSSDLLHMAGSNGSRLHISTSIYGRDSLFQQRQSFMRRTNQERVIVGSIVLDISLRQSGKVINVFNLPSSNVVRPSFTKTPVSCIRGPINMRVMHCASIPYRLLLLHVPQFARDAYGRSNTTCQFWNFTADGTA